MNQGLDLGLWIGPLVAVTAASGLLASGQSTDLAIVVGVALLCIVWWISESVPIPITSLLPLAVLPMFGILTPAQVGQAYGSPLILLLLGGFLLSKSLEHTGAHRRMALAMIRWVGSSSGFRLVLGFSLAAALLSMWISNTATTLMLLPVALAVIDGARDQKKIAPALLLGLAYGASIGGLGTPIGTPANLIFMQVYESTTGRPGRERALGGSAPGDAPPGAAAAASRAPAPSLPDGGGIPAAGCGGLSWLWPGSQPHGRKDPPGQGAAQLATDQQPQPAAAEGRSGSAGRPR